MEHCSRGFTLLELLLVIGVLCLVIAVAVPNFKPVLHEADLEQAARVLEADLQWAQAVARTGESPVWVQFTEEGYSIYQDSLETQGELRNRLWPRTVELVGIDPALSQDKIGFDNRGTPVDASAQELGEDVTVTLRVAKTSRTEVAIKKGSGRVEVTYP